VFGKTAKDEKKIERNIQRKYVEFFRGSILENKPSKKNPTVTRDAN